MWHVFHNGKYITSTPHQPSTAELDAENYHAFEEAHEPGKKPALIDGKFEMIALEIGENSKD